MPADRTERKPTAYETLAAERQRLFDLVRYCRHALHIDGLISDEEYSKILVDGSSGEADGGSVKRLGGYDEVRAAYTTELAALKQERDELRALAMGAAMSLISYEVSYGGGGGTDEAIELAVACGYPEDDPRGEEEIQEWLRKQLATRTAQQEGKP